MKLPTLHISGTGQSCVTPGITLHCCCCCYNYGLHCSPHGVSGDGEGVDERGRGYYDYCGCYGYHNQIRPAPFYDPDSQTSGLRSERCLGYEGWFYACCCYCWHYFGSDVHAGSETEVAQTRWS